MSKLGVWVSLATLFAVAKANEIMDRMPPWTSQLPGYRSIKHNKFRRGRPKRR